MRVRSVMFAVACLAVLPAASSQPLVARASVGPTPWPEQFHAVLFENRSARLALTDLWYDWRGGRNLNIIHSQLGGTVYDVEWTNHTSFIFDLAAETCKQLQFDVGILRPEWMAGAQLLRTELVDAEFECRVWEKADFIEYYEDARSGRPVRWKFLKSGAQFHVMTFQPGSTLPDGEWQAPAFCFHESPAAPLVLGESAATVNSWSLLETPYLQPRASRSPLSASQGDAQ